MSSEPADGHEALLEFLYRSPIGLLQATPDGTITTINPTAAQLLMPVAPSADLSNLFDALSVELPTLRHRIDVGDVPPGGLRFAGAPGQTIGLGLHRLDADTLIVSLADVSPQVEQERARLESSLRDAERTDPLTRLPTRDVLRERLALVLSGGDQARDTDAVAVLNVNVDRFARFNLMHGHDAGDAMLCAIADALTATVRGESWSVRTPERDDLVARLGADDFAVLMRGLRSVDDATRVAQRLVTTLCRSYPVAGQALHASVSVGVAWVDIDPASGGGTCADEALQAALIGMREAKRHGGGRWRLFDPAMRSSEQRRLSVESELRRALERGELFVVYQPIVCLAAPHARVPGVEALVRWRHPVRGIVGPVEFIDVAEQTGLIAPLGAFVLREACAQLAGWRDTLGPAAPQAVSVNLSRAQIDAEGAIVATIGRVLHDSGLPASALQLEVTESLAAQDARAMLAALKALGVTLALDDFGTGYSSLASVHELPIDVLKIDKSFVDQLESSAHHRALVQATVLVARSLGLRTVAEGVETDGQARLLQALGCERAQGFAYARPMPADEAGAWLQAWVRVGRERTATA